MVDAEKLEKHLLDELEFRFDLPSRLSLFFMATGEKPGARIMFVDESKKNLLVKFCDDLELEYRKFSTDFHQKYFISLSKKTFQALEKIEEDKPYHTKKSQGDFLGYPEDAVNFFVENSERELRKEFNEKVDEMLEKDELDEEKLFLIDLVLYIPKPREGSIHEAVENGEKRRELMKQFDRKNNSELGEKLLDQVFDQSNPSFRHFS